MSTIVILGGSRGLGAALCAGLPVAGDRVVVISRTQPNFPEWTREVEYIWHGLDLGTVTTDEMRAAVGEQCIDLLLYVAGIWEEQDLESLADVEIEKIIDVNLRGFLISVKALIANLRLSQAAKIVSIGSTCGLENEGSKSVVYTATKFALRGAVHSIREWLRPHKIAVTCISPGSIARDVSYEEGADAALVKHHSTHIPVGDLVSLVSCIRSMSVASCVKEIHIPALNDEDV